MGGLPSALISKKKIYIYTKESIATKIAMLVNAAVNSQWANVSMLDDPMQSLEQQCKRCLLLMLSLFHLNLLCRSPPCRLRRPLVLSNRHPVATSPCARHLPTGRNPEAKDRFLLLGPLNLTAGEKAALVAFLKAL